MNSPFHCSELAVQYGEREGWSRHLGAACPVHFGTRGRKILQRKRDRFSSDRDDLFARPQTFNTVDNHPSQPPKCPVSPFVMSLRTSSSRTVSAPEGCSKRGLCIGRWHRVAFLDNNDRHLRLRLAAHGGLFWSREDCAATRLDEALDFVRRPEKSMDLGHNISQSTIPPSTFLLLLQKPIC